MEDPAVSRRCLQTEPEPSDPTELEPAGVPTVPEPKSSAGSSFHTEAVQMKTQINVPVPSESGCKVLVLFPVGEAYQAGNGTDGSDCGFEAAAEELAQVLIVMQVLHCCLLVDRQRNNIVRGASTVLVLVLVLVKTCMLTPNVQM